jgi:nicotinamidase/pyrazinamidase
MTTRIVDIIRSSPGKKGLVVIDIQNDFLPGGSLAVPNGDEIFEITQQLLDAPDLWAGIYVSKDWHPQNHCSFAKNNDAQEFTVKILPGIGDQMMWPVHCVQNSFGAELSSAIRWPSDINIVLKGTKENVDSYSAFGDAKDKTLEKTTLESLLLRDNIDSVYCIGLALDFCVAYSAKDAQIAGFKSTVIVPACRGIAKESIEREMEAMRNLGVTMLE